MRDLIALLRTLRRNFLGCEVPVLAGWQGRRGPPRGHAMLGMVRESPELIKTGIAAFRPAKDRPFAVNVIPSATKPGLLGRQISAGLPCREGPGDER